MSRSVDIFVKSAAEIANFALDIESLFNIKLQLISNRQEFWYEFRNHQISLSLGTHDLENDRDMNFEDYPYHISVRAININTEKERQKWCDDFALFVFDKFKSTNKYSLMLVEDLQKKLEEFSPISMIKSR
jgi:hypothetical protein